MSPDPYQAIIPVWLVLVIGVIVLGGVFLLIGALKVPDRTPSPNRQAPHTVCGTPRPVFIDCVQEGWLDPPIERELADLWVKFEEARAEHPPVIGDGARARGLSVVDQRVQSDLYPGTVPAHELYPGGAA